MFATATEAFKADPASAAIFLDHGRPFGAGDRLVQHDLAATLRQISEAGAAGFYQGPVGAAIVASSQAGKGIITQADLDQYATRELAPVECDYRGYHIVSAPPPSSGGVIVCEILNILEGYPLQRLGLSLGAGGARPDRGDAPRLRRPQQLPRRSGLREEPGRRACSTRTTRRRSAPPSIRRRPAISQGPQARRRAARGQQHDALLDRRRPGQCGRRHLHAQRLVRCQGHGGRHRRAAQRRDGRLHRQGRRAEHLRPGAGRGERDRAGQAAAELDEPDHRHQGRQAGDGARHAGRQPHHHRRRARDPQRDRLRHGRSRKRSTRRASTSSGCRTRPTWSASRSARTRSGSSRPWGTCSRARSRPTTSPRSWSARRRSAPSRSATNRFYGANDPRRNTGLALGW